MEVLDGTGGDVINMWLATCLSSESPSSCKDRIKNELLEYLLAFEQ